MNCANFDGIQSGETIYHWEVPVTVGRVSSPSMIEVIYPNKDVEWITEFGTINTGRNQQRQYFWQPVRRPNAPDRPKRRKKKYLLLLRRKGSSDHWIINRRESNGEDVYYDTLKEIIDQMENTSTSTDYFEYTHAEVTVNL